MSLSEELTANDLTNHGYEMKTVQNPQKDGVQRTSGLGNTWRFGESGTLEKAWKLCTPFPCSVLDAPRPSVRS